MDWRLGSADKGSMHGQEGQPADLQERKQWPWWKAKKWMLHISHRLFQRYGDPKLTNPRLARARLRGALEAPLLRAVPGSPHGPAGGHPQGEAPCALELR